jgi:diguanylate cyclase
MQAVFDLLPDAAFVVDRRAMTVSEVNRAACACLGYAREEVRGMVLHEICPPQDIVALAKRFENMSDGKPATAMLRTTQRSKSGQVVAVEWHVSLFHEAAGDYWIIVSRPLAASQRADVPTEAQGESYGLGLPGHDPLTGLPDRRLFERRLERAMQRSHQHDDYRFAVCFIDLDGFKAVNDSFGHLTGDRILCEVARRLVGCVRASDMAARFGGDEFTVFLDDAGTEHDVGHVAQRILEHLQAAIAVDDGFLNVKVSIGVAVHSADCRTIEDLLRRADRAMYRVKALGGGQAST